MAGGSGKMSPRQRMINLMYIVLTAMLALSVERRAQRVQSSAGGIAAYCREYLGS